LLPFSFAGCPRTVSAVCPLVVVTEQKNKTIWVCDPHTKKERVRFQEFVTQRVRDPHTKKEKLKNNKEEQTQSSVR
jgi:hypothetical protein